VFIFLLVWKNDPTILSEEKEDSFVDRLKAQGYEVELFARNLYPNAKLVTGKLQDAATQTNDFLEGGSKELFQASFLVDDLFASCDILLWNEMFGAWDIIEVKSSTDKGYQKNKKKEHILDASFQRHVAQKTGLKVVNVYLLELNKKYYKNGEINPNELFNLTEITTECIDLEDQIIADLQDVKSLLGNSNPLEYSCKYKGRSRHCRSFNYLYTTVPKYSVYDLRAIGASKKKLCNLIDSGYLKLEDIPDDFELTNRHARQRRVTITNETIFEKEKIQQQFDELEYPLYFLDYETLACGIPKFDNTYPYQQTVFQYSLHILQRDGTITHKEYIHKDQSTPVYIIAKKLREEFGDQGHVVVWNRSFEGKCHQDLAIINPELSDFLLGLNDRIYDLMKIFERMEYLHTDFKGKYSIKNILPVMCPELSYDNLQVSNGAEAVVEYENLVFGDVPNELREDKFYALLEYCKLDTWAMVRIFQELEKMVNSN